ncbi:MAG TPA: EamA family transporter [Pyrinomonadaceae bacterium]|nr:EamA family transporter [Pyrinomonadaceae bacterium]
MAFDFRLLSLTALTILMWGCWGFFGKLALERRMSPLTVFLAEIIVSALCAVPVLLALRRAQGGAQALSSWNVFGVLSGTGLALGLVCYYFALERAEASVIVPVTSVYPVISVLLSYLLLGERLRPAQWLGVALVVLGVALLLSGPGAATHAEGGPTASAAERE